jgi:type IV pilus assembly protein PilO
MSALAAIRPKISVGTMFVRMRALLSPLNLHWSGVGLLALVNLYLLAQMGFLWQTSSRHNTDAIAQQRIQLKTAGMAAQPLRGLDAKLARATQEADRFTRQRLPASDSEVAAELGVLTKKQAVRLTRAQYTHSTVLAGTPNQLTEVRIDATLSGDYRPLVQFINSLERDKLFFVINTLTLTGQQSGTVNLKVGMKTYEQGVVAQDQPSTEGAASGGSDGGPAR